MSAPMAANTSFFRLARSGIRMVSGDTSRISSVSPQKICMAVSIWPRASTEKASLNRLHWAGPDTLAGCAAENSGWPSAVVMSKVLPLNCTVEAALMAPPYRAAPNSSRVR